jgi:hypothetical protein
VVEGVSQVWSRFLGGFSSFGVGGLSFLHGVYENCIQGTSQCDAMVDEILCRHS